MNDLLAAAFEGDSDEERQGLLMVLWAWHSLDSLHLSISGGKKKDKKKAGKGKNL